MPKGQPWDVYTEHLSVLGEWTPLGTVARDAVAMVKENPGGPEVALQAVQLLQKTWATLPPDIRAAAMDALQTVGEQVFEAWDKMADQVSGNFIAELVVAGIDAVFQIAEGIKGTNDIKRAASNYEHGNAQAKSMRGWSHGNSPNRGVYGPHGGLYFVMTCYTYSQFIKLRPGGNYDVKPCFTRPGLERDSIFMGHASAPDGTKKVDGSPACAYERKQKVGDSFGPFNFGPCHRKLGVSAMLWPWWSAAYEAKPLARWQGAPAGAPFQPGLSADTNGLLIGQQTDLITDARVNLEQSMRTLEYKVQHFLNFWDRGNTVGKYATPPPGQQVGTTTVRQILRLEMREGGDAKLIDPREDKNHTPHEGAAAYWYYDDAGSIVPYPNQPNASRDAWGVELPPGSSNAPKRLAVSITQYNAVISARAAFAQRRLATLRTPSLVRGVIADAGIDNLDRDARSAIEYARDSTDAKLPDPGASTPKRATVRKGKIKPKRMHLPGRLPPLDKPGGGVSPVALGVGAVAAAAAIGGAVYLNKGK